MGLTHPRLRRAIALTITPALVAGVIAATATAANAVSVTPVSSSALPTVQVDGVVWAQAVMNGVDYVGGDFDTSRPAGASKSSPGTARSNLLAYDISTGEALPQFNAVTNAQVRGIAAAPDGSRIYIVGNFTSVNGQPRNHVAALDASGNLLPFAPSANGTVNAVAATSSAVYFGGTFTTVNGAARSRAAAASPAGALLGWNPAVSDNAVRALAVASNGSKVLLGGSFTNVGGEAHKALAAVDPVSGKSVPWAENGLVYNSGPNSAIYSLSTRGGAVYATGYVLGGLANGNLEGTVAMRWSDGGVIWLEDCHGDTYSSTPFNDAVYVAGHAHDCARIGGFGPSDPPVYHRGLAFTQQATGTVQHNTVAAYYEFQGQPAPTLLDWYPDFNVGTFTGMSQGPWSVASGGSYVVYGGEFTKVNGTLQTGLVRFLGRPEAADPITSPTATPTPTPTSSSTPTDPTTTPTGPTSSAPVTSVPNRVAHPNAVPLGPTRVAVKWSAPKAARADKVTGYTVKVYKGSKVVKTVKLGAAKRLAVVAGLKKSTTYKVGVTAVNKKGAGKQSVLDPAKTKAKGKNVSATKKPSKVSKPKATVGKARIRVRWTGASTKGALGVSKYQVRIVKNRRTVEVLSVDASLRSKLVTKLGRHAAYTVSVRAYSWAGWSAWSVGKAVRTR